MRSIRRAVVSMIVLALASGCTAASSKAREYPAESDAVVEPARFEMHDVECPVVPYDEYRLPESVYIDDYETRFAVGSDSCTNEGLGSIVLLDMDSATSATVLSSPLTHEQGFSIITTRCSDRWIAWEEFAGNEQDDPWNVEWKLYAAPIASEGDAIGEPRLIAESVTSIHSRPLFQVLGDRLYFMTNSMSNSEQEGAVRGSEIQEYDLLTGGQRYVFTSPLNTHTFCAQGDELLVSVYPESANVTERVQVLGLADGKEHFSADLENGDFPVSHWPAHQGGVLVWGELYSPNAWLPRLWLQTDGGKRFVLTDTGSDPCFVGSLLVYETANLDGPGGVPWPTINVLDTTSGEHYVLLRTPGSMELPGYMLLAAQPPMESVLVVADTVFGGDAVEMSGTWVRRYHLQVPTM